MCRQCTAHCYGPCFASQECTEELPPTDCTLNVPPVCMVPSYLQMLPHEHTLVMTVATRPFLRDLEAAPLLMKGVEPLTVFWAGEREVCGFPSSPLGDRGAPSAPASSGCWQEERRKMMPNSGASLLLRENAAGALTSTSHLVRPGSARMRTCAENVR